MKKNLEVVPVGNGWAVIKENTVRPLLLSSRQHEAIAFARELASKARIEVAVYGRNEQVRERISYKTKPGVKKAPAA